jgi:hypothetical protein
MIQFLRQEQLAAEGVPREEARKRALAQLCRVILNLNEFMYAD